MFTEKIFLLLWIWLLLLIFLTTGSLIYWSLSQFLSKNRISFVHKHLELSSQPPSKQDKRLRKFTLNFLRPDGLFILRMIAGHSGSTMCTEIVHELWARFQSRNAVGANPEINKAFLDEDSAEESVIEPLVKSSKQFEAYLDVDEASSATEPISRPLLKATANIPSQLPRTTKRNVEDTSTQTTSDTSVSVILNTADNH